MKRSLQLALGFFLIATACGQEIREITFTVYGQYPVRDVIYDPVSPEAIVAGVAAKESVMVATHSLSRMGPYDFSGASIVEFKDANTNTLVAKVSIPEVTNKWLFIFVRNPDYKIDPENNLKYHIYPFDDSLVNLPKNGLVFLNISGKDLDGLIEHKRVKLPRGESGSYRVQESLPINLWTRNFNGSKLLPALVKTYNFEPDHRYLMIFFQPVLRGSSDLDVRFISELVE